jgi:hypothetical protein
LKFEIDDCDPKGDAAIGAAEPEEVPGSRPYGKADDCLGGTEVELESDEPPRRKSRPRNPVSSPQAGDVPVTAMTSPSATRRLERL